MSDGLLKLLTGRATPPDSWFSVPSAQPGPHGVTLTYLGTAGFLLSADGHSIALDPYLSRAGIPRLLLGRLPVDGAALIERAADVRDVFVGHAHFDHVLDSPALCAHTGARLIGARAVCMVGRAAGLPEAQLRETAGREDIQSGPFSVRGLPSAHGKVLFGRVPFPGDMKSPPPWPPRMRELKHGLVLNWLVKKGNFSLVHVDSAEFFARELQGHRADVICLCAAGWRTRPDYVAEIARVLKPRIIMACHWDTMITPHTEPMCMIPNVDLKALLDEIRAANVTPLLLPMLGRWQF